jgi:FkbM family methyltransferase
MMQQVKDKFKKGEISKVEFIDTMYQSHQSLFDYVEVLKTSDIAEIKITTEGVLFTSKKDGIKIFCIKNDKRTAPFEILNFDEYEIGDADLLFSLLKNGDNVFDIGANIGWYSISMAKKFPLSTIYAFEPLPATFKNLQNNVQLNESKNVIINNFGFSNSNTTLTFYSSPHTSVSNSAENITGAGDAVKVECVVKTLDSYVAENALKIDVIKCDVEGAELFVYEGGVKVLSENKPLIFTEMLRKWSAKFNYHPDKIIALLQTIGYKCFYNPGSNKLKEILKVTEETTATNFFFLHAEKHRSIIDQYAI